MRKAGRATITALLLAALAVYARRRSATPFTMIYPLMFVHSRYKEMQELAWKDITLARPKFILVINLRTSILWDGKADLSFVDKVRQLVDTGYHLVGKEVDDGGEIILLYQRNDPQGLLKDISGR